MIIIVYFSGICMYWKQIKTKMKKHRCTLNKYNHQGITDINSSESGRLAVM
jgi:hypothetical protein